MKYFEIDKKDVNFNTLTLEKVLQKIQTFESLYVWSIQLIEGVGNVEGTIEMSIVELEQYCDQSDKGFITDFSTMIKLSKACIDIVEVLVIGCEGKNKIPKPYKTPNWEDNCAVIISKEDSSLWQLFSINEDIMDAFYLLR